MQRIAVIDRRAALLDAAVRVIARSGLAQTSVRDIAAEAGMSVASFHYVFASKQAMLRELIGAVLDDQRASVTAALEDAHDLGAFVRVALQAWLDRAVSAPDAELALQELLVWSRTAPGMGELAVGLYRAYERTVLTVVTASRARFGTTWSVPDEEVARLALVLTDGVALRWTVDRDEAAARRALEHGAAAVLALAGGEPS